jgi:hypothetical protein
MVVQILFGVAENVALLAGEDLPDFVASRPRVIVHLGGNIVSHFQGNGMRSCMFGQKWYSCKEQK